MKAEILSQKIIAQGDIQAVDAKAKNYSEVLDDLKTFIKLAL